jgi:hypothetical protein
MLSRPRSPASRFAARSSTRRLSSPGSIACGWSKRSRRRRNTLRAGMARGPQSLRLPSYTPPAGSCCAEDCRSNICRGSSTGLRGQRCARRARCAGSSPSARGCALRRGDIAVASVAGAAGPDTATETLRAVSAGAAEPDMALEDMLRVNIVPSDGAAEPVTLPAAILRGPLTAIGQAESARFVRNVKAGRSGSAGQLRSQSAPANCAGIDRRARFRARANFRLSKMALGRRGTK